MSVVAWGLASFTGEEVFHPTYVKLNVSQTPVTVQQIQQRSSSPSSPSPLRYSNPPSLAPSPQHSMDNKASAPLYVQLSSDGELDVPSTLLAIARRFEKLEIWTVSHVRALEERMGDVERWLVEKEKDSQSQHQGQQSRDTPDLSQDVSDIREEMTKLQGRMSKIGREMAKLATFPSNLSNAPSRGQTVREHHQELEGQERKAREEADGLRKRIAEMQSKLEEDRHTSGKASVTYSNPRDVHSHPIRKHCSPGPTACLPLDRSSPKFANRLDDALHGRDYERCVQNFKEDDIVWFVDYLDKACHHHPLSHCSLELSSRLSTVSIPWDLLPESVCVNSEACVRLTLHFQHPMRFLPTFLPLIPMRSPPAVSLMCIADPSMAYRFASNVCE